MRKKRVLVVGTGAGGAMAARELSKSCSVTILEAGGEFQPFTYPMDTLASLRKSGLFFDESLISLLLPNMRISKDPEMVLVSGRGLGGTTTLATGNAVRADEALKEIGLDLDAEFSSLYDELPVTCAHQEYWSPAAKRLYSAFEAQGLSPRVTPKFLRYPRCQKCGRCAVGCKGRFKWDTRDLIEEAVKNGAWLHTGVTADRLLFEGGHVTGVIAASGSKEVIFRADRIVLSAGGLGTPKILSNSGIRCRDTLFVDPVLCVAAVRKNFHQEKDLLMPFYSERSGYMLSPYMDDLSFFFNKRWRYPMGDLVSLMVKMADDSAGCVEGKKVSKPLTGEDIGRLRSGVSDCIGVLSEMGIKKSEMFLGTLNAGHPGGMLPLNERSAKNLQDERLPREVFVADATILPRSMGLPPMLTIMALSKKISSVLLQS